MEKHMSGCCRGLPAKACIARPYGCSDEPPRYYVQGETVRGEPRVYWVVDREQHHKTVSKVTTDKRQAERWLNKLQRDS
jgi:hypothetical protein